MRGVVGLGWEGKLCDPCAGPIRRSDPTCGGLPAKLTLSLGAAVFAGKREALLDGVRGVKCTAVVSSAVDVFVRWEGGFDYVSVRCAWGEGFRYNAKWV